jgi:hypothetical protein
MEPAPSTSEVISRRWLGWQPVTPFFLRKIGGEALFLDYWAL